MKRLINVAALLFAAGPAAAAAPSFPPNSSQEAIAAWAKANTTLAPDTIISAGGGRLVGMVERGADPAGGGLMRITVRTEIIDPKVAAIASALSESQTLSVDCAAQKARGGPMAAHPRRNLAGAPKVQPGWTEWKTAAPGSVLDRIIDAACPPAAKRTGDALMTAPFAAAPLAPPATALAQTPPAPEPEPILPPPSPAPVAAKSPEPAPSPEPESEPAPPPPPRVQATKPATGRISIQVAAGDSRKGAEAALRRARAAAPALLAGHEGRIDPVTVAGVPYFRALFGGFETSAQASKACTALKSASQACFVRP